MDTSENEANNHRQKRPIEVTSSDDDDDIDEEELLKSDDESRDDTKDTDDLAEDLTKFKLTDSISDAEDNGDEESSNEPERGLNLRNYQLELAELAIQGKNTIVHAATGAGKTRVALYIVKNHLEKTPNGKVAFMAEKNFLVNQHHRSLKKILPEYTDETVCISAQKEKSDDLHKLIDDYKIFLMTPAMVKNTLSHHGTHFLSKLTLMVFDECHHTKKKSVYNRLMVDYHLLKKERQSIPQILGLTATLDAQKANSVEKATEKGITVMANLDVTKLSTVVRYKNEYDKFRKDIAIVNYRLPDTNNTDVVHQYIETAMGETEDIIRSVKEVYGFKGLDEDECQKLRKTLSQGAYPKMDPSYITWTSEMGVTATTILGKRPDIANVLTIGSSYLKIYSEVLGMNDELTGVYALQSLHQKLKGQNLGEYSVRKEEKGNFESRLANVAKVLEKDIDTADKTITNGKKIHKLLTLIRDEISKETRFIIMVKTREVAEMLTTLLKDEGVTCAAFTGSSASTDAGGTSRAEQENAVKEFNNGELNGLVATNILEEGLDIPDCNFVINYNYVGNEISTRQTAGRIRKQSGKQIVIANSKDSLRHTVNVRRGLIMDEAVEKILDMNEDDLCKTVHRIQSDIIADELKRQSESRRPKRPRLDNTRFKMVCKACAKFKVDCSTIRSIKKTHHVAVDPSIWQRISIKAFKKKKPKFDPEIICQGIMFGKSQERSENIEHKCTHELGIVSTYKGIRLPFLSYKFLPVLDTTTNKTIQLTKWDEAPFTIQEITEEDLNIMQMTA